MKKSWKTSLAGILVILASVFTAASAMLDDDPSTNPNFEQVVGTILGAGLLNARDKNVSSEQQGIK